MRQGTTHIIGAGLAGLSAATALAEKGRHVLVYEASAQAGGRCRSYHDATLDAIIDNGNHLLLSGNDAALGYLKRIGSDKAFAAAQEPVFDFIDAQTTERWRLHLSKGRLPLWLFDKERRVPGTKASEYFSILRLLKAGPQQTVASVLDSSSALYKRLWHTLLLSSLNTDLTQASAHLAGAILRGTLLKGGSACIPLVAEGLSSTFIDPALCYLKERGAEVKLNQRVRRIDLNGSSAVGLEFTSGEKMALATDDTVICAVPFSGAETLLPGISAPKEHRAILNAHFRITPPPSFPKIMGVINATTEWIFSFPDRISITVSAADRLIGEEREVLAKRLWSEVSALTSLPATPPPWQIVKEKRATFAATPQEDARRPGTNTAWRNVWLAGDWVQTGLPATIEGAVRSGARAAEMRMHA
jgi:squalene-associated FAD-dependent desaturase